MWHGCAKKIYQLFLYNTMSHKTIGGVYMVMNGIYLVIASACIPNFSVPLLWGFHSGESINIG